MKRNYRCLLIILLVISLLLSGCTFLLPRNKHYSASVMDVPAFSGEPYVIINDNLPEFADKDLTTDAYEFYSELDYLGRCGYAMACVGKELMPTEGRESISQVKPSGWVQENYSFIDGENLYNRCHLIGFQLTGENANEKNLITGTRYMNVDGMLPFENMIADYIKETGNHVLYRVTPVFDEGNLVARGVQMEAVSVEDSGEGICFNVYVYNNQPGVVIDYLTGESREEGKSETTAPSAENTNYILNTKSKKFHLADCAQSKNIAQNNMQLFSGDRELLIQDGYEAAKCCNP